MITCEETQECEDYTGPPQYDEEPKNNTLEDSPTEENLEASLNALEGQSNPQMTGYIGKKPISILIDKGRTHNTLKQQKNSSVL